MTSDGLCDDLSLIEVDVKDYRALLMNSPFCGGFGIH